MLAPRVDIAPNLRTIPGPITKTANNFVSLCMEKVWLHTLHSGIPSSLLLPPSKKKKRNRVSSSIMLRDVERGLRVTMTLGRLVDPEEREVKSLCCWGILRQGTSSSTIKITLASPMRGYINPALERPSISGKKKIKENKHHREARDTTGVVFLFWED